MIVEAWQAAACQASECLFVRQYTRLRRDHLAEHRASESPFFTMRAKNTCMKPGRLQPAGLRRAHLADETPGFGEPIWTKHRVSERPFGRPNTGFQRDRWPKHRAMLGLEEIIWQNWALIIWQPKHWASKRSLGSPNTWLQRDHMAGFREPIWFGANTSSARAQITT